MKDIKENCLLDDRGCWIWQKCKHKASGYGMVGFRGKVWQAHRVSYVQYVGEIPEKMLVCHTCDVRLCCNPEHLFIGTHKDNNVDCVAKGRHRTSIIKFGESNPSSKLTEAQISSIRLREHTGPEYSAMFGISVNHVYKVWRGEAWKPKESK